LVCNALCFDGPLANCSATGPSPRFKSDWAHAPPPPQACPPPALFGKSQGQFLRLCMGGLFRANPWLAALKIYPDSSRRNPCAHPTAAFASLRCLAFAEIFLNQPMPHLSLGKRLAQTSSRLRRVLRPLITDALERVLPASPFGQTLHPGERLRKTSIRPTRRNLPH